MTTAVPHPFRRTDNRRMNLLGSIAAEGGEWTVGRVKQLYRRRIRRHIYRSTIRRDLEALHRDGHLDRHGDGTARRYYTHRQEGPDT